jgi:hypothetical protein
VTSIEVGQQALVRPVQVLLASCYVGVIFHEVLKLGTEVLLPHNTVNGICGAHCLFKNWLKLLVVSHFVCLVTVRNIHQPRLSNLLSMCFHDLSIG